MARGKYARRSDVRSETAAHVRIAELEQLLAEEKQRAHQVQSGLQDELEAVQAKLLRQVKSMADARVLAAQEEARDRLNNERERFADRVRKASKVLSEHGVGLTMKAWSDLADALQVPPSLILGAAGDNEDSNRHARRANRTAGHLIAESARPTQQSRLALLQATQAATHADS